MLLHEARLGQEVSFHWKGAKYFGKIIKINPKRAKVATTTPAVYSAVNVPYAMLRDESGGSSASAAPATPAATWTPVKEFHKGQVVKCPDLNDDLFVILSSRNGGAMGLTYSVAKLGGDRGLYYTGMLASQFEEVNFELAGV